MDTQKTNNRYYIEIRFIQPYISEYSPFELFATVYKNIHFALFDYKKMNKSEKIDIGISFPQYNLKEKKFGNIIRLHGEKEPLHQFYDILISKLEAFKDNYIFIRKCQPVPSEVIKYVRYKRVNLCTPNLWKKRTMKRMHKNKQTIENINKIYNNFEVKYIDYPYIKAYSMSTNSYFNLFVQEVPMGMLITKNDFNTYGFSQQSTVEIF
jgi:CRISPR-associated endoribonuclease Cas6/Csy4 subtype I-F